MISNRILNKISKIVKYLKLNIFFQSHILSFYLRKKKPSFYTMVLIVKDLFPINP